MEKTGRYTPRIVTFRLCGQAESMCEKEKAVPLNMFFIIIKEMLYCPQAAKIIITMIERGINIEMMHSIPITL
ncbi:hypothetical protein [Salibacterium lacus]|uniref:Uncharacterized protein n=1 Tax=Salibacterium lacus TaxID=1898109 RepID=A0ABW5SZ27_9BACI